MKFLAGHAHEFRIYGRTTEEGFKQWCDMREFRLELQNVTDGLGWGQQMVSEEGRLTMYAKWKGGYDRLVLEELPELTQGRDKAQRRKDG